MAGPAAQEPVIADLEFSIANPLGTSFRWRMIEIEKRASRDGG
jgi:hypothetical protein